MSASLQITAHWFPPHERNTATSVGQLFNALGVGLSFILGFTVVKEASEESGTVCDESITFKDLEPRDTRDDIMNLNYIHAGLDIILFLLILIHYPSKPKNPPSISSAEERLDFIGGFKILAKSRDAWLILIAYAFPSCLLQLWQSMMVVSFTELDFKFSNVTSDVNDNCSYELCEHWVEVFGIVMCFVSIFTSIGVASFLSIFKRRMKLSIMILLGLSGIFMIFGTLILEQVITFSNLSGLKLALYLVLLPGTTLALCSSPITFELSVENAFPVNEGVIGGWLTGWFNALGAVFFLIFLIPGIGTRWLNYVLPFSVIAPIPFIAMVTDIVGSGLY